MNYQWKQKGLASLGSYVDITDEDEVTGIAQQLHMQCKKVTMYASPKTIIMTFYEEDRRW